MRFELFLTELPKASVAKVQAALAELPKGASTGTILKSIEARTVPTVSVAWSEDKRVLNEVMDTLLELGGGCKLVDHGSLAQKLVTFSAEKMGRSRYLEDEEDEDSRKYVKMGSRKNSETLGAALTRHALTYFLQLCLTGVLFVWYVALRVGLEKVMAMPELASQLAACAAGLFVVYLVTGSIREVQAGRLTVKHIIPQIVVGVCLTVIACFFLGDSVDDNQVADGSVKRPPSLPYSGLLTELHKRKLAKEASGHDSENQTGSAAELAAREEGAEAELWCERPVELELACEGGRAWEEAFACLPKPEWQARAKPKLARVQKAPARQEEPAKAPAAPPPVAENIEQTWAVTLDSSTLLTLAGMWLLSLVGLFLQLGPQPLVKAGATPAQGQPLSATATSATSVDDGQLALARAEIDGLRAELSQARAARAQADAEAEQPVTDKPEVSTLQRELALSRGALAAHQTALAELKQQLAQASAEGTKLSSENERFQQELSWTIAERDQARSALLEMGARSLEVGPPENDARERHTGVTRHEVEQDEGESSYSVSRVQEERVVLQKRKR